MSYPPPPGLPSKPSHPSLPARPPPPTATQPYKNAIRPAPAFAGFAPRSVASSATPFQSYSPAPQQPQPYHSYNAQSSHPNDVYGSGGNSVPQIRNPFAPPSAVVRGGYDDDPEMAAQIAQWQSAYAGKDASASGGGYSNSGYTGPVLKRNLAGMEGQSSATSANAAPLGGFASRETPGDVNTSGVSDATPGKTVVRSGGGTSWTDSSLLEWDPAHFRLFVGNLAGEVTDESLYKAFSRWPSVQKARVIREKRTTKSKGYGFVSFSDGDEFFQAARDMQGKYIGSHPVLLRRSTTEIKAVAPKDNNRGKGKGKGKTAKHESKRKGDGEANMRSGDKTGAGIQKAGSMTKGGLRILG